MRVERPPSYVMSNGEDGRRISVSGPTQLDAVDAAVFDASGATSVNGDLRADHSDVSGATTVGGDIVGEELDGSGSIEVGGDVAVEQIDVSGATEIEGDITAVTLDSSGALEVDGRIGAERLEASGSLSASAIDAGHMDSSGAARVDTLVAETVEGSGVLDSESVEAGTFELILDDESTIETLQAEEVTVKPDSDRDGILGNALDFLSGDGHLTATKITAETASLEHVDVDELRVGEATLGPDVHVGDLYAREWEADSDATIDRVHERGATPDEAA
jgi:cytoskeletal protein CcmA (bactofilin family)